MMVAVSMVKIVVLLLGDGGFAVVVVVVVIVVVVCPAVQPGCTNRKWKTGRRWFLVGWLFVWIEFFCVSCFFSNVAVIPWDFCVFFLLLVVRGEGGGGGVEKNFTLARHGPVYRAGSPASKTVM